jgi:hypothetical protein
LAINSIPDYDAAARNGSTRAKFEDDSEWVTITEAAHRLGIHPRQARRYADRLKGTEDRTPEDASPVRVRLSSLMSLRNRAAEKETGQEGQGQDSEDSGRNRPLTEVEFLRAQLVQKDTQIAELHRLMFADKAELSELRQRAALPPAPADEPTTTTTTVTRPWWAWWRR